MLISLVYLLFFFIPLFFEKSKLRSSVIDLERQIDYALNRNSNITVFIDFKIEKIWLFTILIQDDSLVETVLINGVLGNYEPKIFPSTGPGENGSEVILEQNEKDKAQRLINEFGFNMVASDKISLDRRIKDTRPAEYILLKQYNEYIKNLICWRCKYWHYPMKLPTASVVIVFHNEGWSTLIRTVHSAINNSPPELLSDIVLVDDYSNKGTISSLFLLIFLL